MNMEWRDAEGVMAEISGEQLMDWHIEGTSGLHLRFGNDVVLVIVGLPDIALALLRPERNVH